MHRGGAEQILAPRHQRHPLGRVIANDAEVIAEAGILARQHHIAMVFGAAAQPPAGQVGEEQRPRIGPRHIQPPGMRLPRGNPPCSLTRSQPPTGPRINRPISPLGRSTRRRNIRPGAKTRVKPWPQPRQSRPVFRRMRALHPHRPIPTHPQPGQIFGNRRRIFRPAPPLIDILQPQQKPLPPRARKKRREGVAKMQITGRARGEAGGVVHTPHSPHCVTHRQH